MKTTHEMLQVLTDNKPTRYYMDGKRVSEHTYSWYYNRAERVFNMTTRCVPLGGLCAIWGQFRRYNRSTVEGEYIGYCNRA